MALRPLWVAWQGLTIGLTPVVVAIQGLWPDEEDEAPPPFYTFGGGGGSTRKVSTARDRFIERQKRLFAENMNIIALICAVAVEEYA